jgi:osmotically-inducible protein OsmY
MMGRVGWIVTFVGVALVSCRPELRYRTPSEFGAPLSPHAVANAPARQRTESARPSDHELGLAVRRALDADPGILAHRIDVAVEAAVVTLSGTVASGLAAERAIARAETIRGVLEIQSELELAPPVVPDRELELRVRAVLEADPATAKSRISVSARQGRVVLSGKLESAALRSIAAQGSLSIRGVSAVSDRLELPMLGPRADGSTQRAIERRFAIDACLHDQPVRVRVRDGEVVLEGTVQSLWLKRRARELAEHAGQRPVAHDALRVEQAASAADASVAAYSDEQTRAAIVEVLRGDSRLSGITVEVDVRGGAVTLSGVVASLRSKIAAERDALSVLGVWEVENRLQVRPPELVADRIVAERVRERLQWDALTSGHELRVAVSNGRAVLYGDLGSRDLGSHAELVVASVPGLIAVDNRTSTGHEGVARDDTAIEGEIRAGLRWDARVDATRISVEVHDAVAFLRGEVASRAGYDAVLENAFLARPREVVVGLRRDLRTSRR